MCEHNKLYVQPKQNKHESTTPLQTITRSHNVFITQI